MEEKNIEEIDSLKLQKFTKGYGWKISTSGLDVEKLEEINNKFRKKFLELDKE